ncbi:MAG: HipA domain-containing protein [Verrucomicrobiae bacterium]|nr:HipA domain-containing protein [Verrucomicrobiae bacterium]
MRFCPITLQEIRDEESFSRDGLRSFHPRLQDLAQLELSNEEQLSQARLRADKMSVQGVQPKLSAQLRVKEGKFDIVDREGQFLLKPNPPTFTEVPANEALTMTMAASVGLTVPPHGLIPTIDGSWIYVIKRFDREGRNRRIHVEDFAQLSGATRETKYESSLERVAKIVEEFCTFPALEKPKLAKLLLFCFLSGNEGMHLKNFSLIVSEGVVTLSPAYDLLNTTLVLENAKEESALPLGGKKNNLTRKLWLEYYCIDRLQLPTKQITQILEELESAVPSLHALIDRSFLTQDRRDKYREILEERTQRLGLKSS